MIQRRERGVGRAKTGPAVCELKPASSRQSPASVVRPAPTCSASAVTPAGRRRGCSRCRHLGRQNVELRIKRRSRLSAWRHSAPRVSRVLPVRLRGLSGSLDARLGERGAGRARGRLGERRTGWSVGRSGVKGGAGSLGRGSLTGSSGWGVLEREATLQDLRRGNLSVGWAWPWERVLGILDLKHTGSINNQTRE